MKLLHTADWHLGRILYGRSMLEDQRYFIHSFLFPLIDREKPDALLLSGDIFDRQIAPVEAIRLFDDFVTGLCVDRQIPLVAIAGNHDGADRLGLGARLYRAAGFYLTARLDPGAPPVKFPDQDREVHIYSLPYFDPATARDCLSDPSIRGCGDAFAAVLDRLRQRLDPAACNILLAHCFVTGAAVSDSESPLFIGGSGEVDAGLFQDFDYVALGHLHRAQRAGEDGVRYAGSPLKYSFDEENHHKSVTILEIGQGLSVRQVPVKPLRDMRTVTGSLDQLRTQALAPENRLGREDYIYAVLSGPPVFEPMSRLREFYPNALGVINGADPAAGETAERSALRRNLRRRDSMTLFEEFLRQMCDTEPTEDDRAVFQEIGGALLGSGQPADDTGPADAQADFFRPTGSRPETTEEGK